jgi:hypothetical protein
MSKNQPIPQPQRKSKANEELSSILYLFYFYSNLHEIKHIATIRDHLADAFASNNPLQL